MLFRGDSHGAGHIQGWEQIQIRGQKAVSTQLMQPAFPTGIQNNAKYFEKKKNQHFGTSEVLGRD